MHDASEDCYEDVHEAENKDGHEGKPENDHEDGHEVGYKDGGIKQEANDRDRCEDKNEEVHDGHEDMKIDKSGEKRHHCEICNKSFQKKWNLKVHMQSHTDERLYKCTLCQSPKNFNSF